MNRLAHARSPYLLQHKDNPVDWYPWGEEAFARARREDKPVFLSVGYSSCHWCHVMEHESFEDEGVARILNESFVSIKVDREERPDVDDVYMRVTQLLTGSGGWPMTVFLTPDKRPFFAGTYFPKEPRFGQPAFPRILEEVRKAWQERRAEVERSASEIAAAAARADLLPPPALDAKLDASLVAVVAAALERRYDDEHGGFGGAPKFPPHHALRLFIAERERAGPAALKMALATLDAMAAGGIHDHIGGGFARYSVDREWIVPHFEKMLYDNAMLARAYVSAFEATGAARYRRVAEGIFAWIAREMTDPAGGFYSALDADSEGEEGKYYVWTPAEVAAVLGDDAAAREFSKFYDITERGNFEGKSIPRIPSGALDEAPRFDGAREKLLAARRKRVPPGLDDKVIASWNGLMIGALARAFAVLGEDRHRAAAEKAAAFLLEAMRDRDGTLLRTWRGGAAGIPGYLEDHACLADGLLDLHDATGEARWLAAARDLADRILREFADEEKGGFFTSTPRHEKLLFREKDFLDGATPSGSGVAARVLARLARKPGGETYGPAADGAIRAVAGALPKLGTNMLTIVEAIAIRGEVGKAGLALPPVTATARLEGRPAPGASFEVRVALALRDGFHVNGREPASENLVPTAVTLETTLPIAAKAPLYPPGATWEHAAEIRIPCEVAATALPASGIVRVSVKWQACDERACRAPEEKTVDLPVTIGSPAQ